MEANKTISPNFKYRFISLVIVFCLVSFPIVRVRLERVSFLHIEEIAVNSAADIIAIDDSLVTPVIYPNEVGLDSLSGEALKQRFVNVILPAILIAKHRIDSLRRKVARLRNKENWAYADSLFYQQLAVKYKAKDINNLWLKMATHPNSIILAQAAMESGWGTSRFFLEANNLFGIWSFNPNEPRMIAAYKRGTKPIYLRRYNDVSHSIEDYFMVLARGKAYEGFRKSRVFNQDPYEMVNHLIYYSEQRWKYVRLIKLLMRANDFTKYDNYVIDPQYYMAKTHVSWQ